MHQRTLVVALALSSLLAGCVVGAALMPSTTLDPVAKVYLDGPPWALERLRRIYRYKIVMTGRDYGFNVHQNLIGALLGIWESWAISEVLYVNQLDGTVLISDRDRIYLVSVPRDAVGSVSFSERALRVDIRWTRQDEKGTSQVHAYQFNGEYQLDSVNEGKEAPKIDTQEDRMKLSPEYDYSYCKEYGMRYNKGNGDWERCRP